MYNYFPQGLYVFVVFLQFFQLEIRRMTSQDWEYPWGYFFTKICMQTVCIFSVPIWNTKTCRADIHLYWTIKKKRCYSIRDQTKLILQFDVFVLFSMNFEYFVSHFRLLTTIQLLFCWTHCVVSQAVNVMFFNVSTNSGGRLLHPEAILSTDLYNSVMEEPLGMKINCVRENMVTILRFG